MLLNLIRFEILFFEGPLLSHRLHAVLPQCLSSATLEQRIITEYSRCDEAQGDHTISCSLAFCTRHRWVHHCMSSLDTWGPVKFNSTIAWMHNSIELNRRPCSSICRSSWTAVSSRQFNWTEILARPLANHMARGIGDYDWHRASRREIGPAHAVGLDLWHKLTSIIIANWNWTLFLLNNTLSLSSFTLGLRNWSACSDFLLAKRMMSSD